MLPGPVISVWTIANQEEIDMKRNSLKTLGLLLAVIMILSLLPLGALSALAEPPETGTEIASAGLALSLPGPGRGQRRLRRGLQREGGLLVQ